MKTIKKMALSALTLMTVNLNISNAQICSGTQGAPIFNETFGSGTNAYGPTLPAGVTTYPYQVGTVPNNGEYAISNTGNPSGTSGYVNAPDHTGNANGYMMVVNASVKADTAYRRNVTGLCPNTRYVFSAWLANNNTTQAAGTCGSYIFPSLKLQVSYPVNMVQNFVLTGNLPTAPTSTAFVWMQYGFAFTTGPSQTSADIFIINAAGGGCGNDFVLDDITFAPCGPLVALSIVPNKTTFCVGEPITLQSTFTSGSYTSPQYQWQFSNNGGSTWANVAGATSQNYNIPSAAIAQGGMYQLLVSENGNINSPNCRIIAGPLTFTVKTCPTSCCLGNLCSYSQNALTGNYEIPLSNFNFNFSGNTTALQQKVNVGINCGTTFPGKFNVTTGLATDPVGPGHSNTIYATNTNATANTNKTGVYGSAINTVAGINRGVWGYASSLRDARGVYGHCGKAISSYGGYFESISSTGNTTNYGIYAKAANASTNWAGYFDGNVIVNGSVAPPSSITNPLTPPAGPYALTVNGNALTTAGAWYLSDKRFKDKIVPLTDVISKLKKVRGYNYIYKTEEFKERNFNTGNQIGLIAQELKEVFPELVKEDSDGYLAVNYQGMVPLLLEATKEQQKRIESQQQQIDELSASVKSLIAKNNSNATTTGIPVNLSDKNTIVLNQNVPNPFAESTVISYNLPTEFNRAQIIFTNNSGVVIKTVDLKEKGVGSLNVFANDLTHGLYSYSLIVDGKIIDTKKMVKE